MSFKFFFKGFDIQVKIYRHYPETSTISFPLPHSVLCSLNPREQVYVNDGVFCCDLSNLGNLVSSSSNETPVFMFDDRRFCSIMIAKLLEVTPRDNFPERFAGFINASHFEAIRLSNLVVS